MLAIIRQVNKNVIPKSKTQVSLERKQSGLKVATFVFLLLGIAGIGGGITLYAAGHSLLPTLIQTTKESIIAGSISTAVGLASVFASIYSLVSFKNFKKFGKSYLFYCIACQWQKAKAEGYEKFEELKEEKIIESFRDGYQEIYKKYTKTKRIIVGMAQDQIFRNFKMDIGNFFESQREFLLTELLTNNSDLFEIDAKDIKCTIDDSWIHLPFFRKPKDVDIKDQHARKSQFEETVRNLKSSAYRKRIEEACSFAEEMGNKIEYMDADSQSVHEESITTLPQNLLNEYKIHLMPKGPYAFATLEKLLEFAKQNKELENVIEGIKISRNAAPRLQDEKYLPVIVIYFKSKENAQKALNLLVPYFKPYFGWGSNLCPRYNVKGENPLIYYAQGDATQKTELENEHPEIFQMLYESDGTCYKTDLGGSHLEHPKGF